MASACSPRRILHPWYHGIAERHKVLLGTKQLVGLAGTYVLPFLIFQTVRMLTKGWGAIKDSEGNIFATNNSSQEPEGQYRNQIGLASRPGYTRP